MTAIRRRSIRDPIGASVALLDADDLDGDLTKSTPADLTDTLDLTGASGAVVIQHNNGTAGTAGIDCLEYSKDGGASWAVAGDALALASNPFTGTILVAGVLNAAGVEPVNMAVFKIPPQQGPCLLRATRKTTTTGGTTWVTGAPTVTAFRIG